MAASRQFPSLRDMAFNVLLKKQGLFSIEIPGDASADYQRQAAHLLEQVLIEKYMPDLLHAVVDGSIERIKELLDDCPQLISVKPDKNLVIESKLTWQKFYAENPLLMAAKRKQLEVFELLFSYLDKLEQTEEIIKLKAQALATWNPYEIKKNGEDKEEIVIPQEYVDYAQSLIDVFKETTFPNGIPGSNGVPMNVALDEKTESTLSLLLNAILLPKKPVKLDDYLDVELLLLAVLKAYDNDNNFNTFQNWEQREAFCIRVVGLIQSVQSPETAAIWCQGLYKIVEGLEQGKKIEVSQLAREFKLKDDKDVIVSYYRSSRDSHLGLGFDFLCGINNSPVRVESSVLLAFLLEKLCRAKTTNFWKLMPQLPQAQNRQCADDKPSFCVMNAC